MSQFAYCHSLKCAGEGHKRVWKRDLASGTRRCPECGGPIAWKSKLHEMDQIRMRRECCAHNFCEVFPWKCKHCGISRHNWEMGWKYWSLDRGKNNGRGSAEP